MPRRPLVRGCASRGWRTVWLLAAASVAWSGAAFAGPRAQEDASIWAGLSGTTREWRGARGSLLVQARTRDDTGELERVLVRPSISLRVFDAVTLALGYDAHLIRNPRHIEEHRIWQEAGFSTPIEALGALGVHHRIRLEERLLERVDGAAWRLRYRLQLRSPELFAKTHAVVREEAIFALNEPSRTIDAGLSENRFFVGAQFVLSERMSGELGYQTQWLRRRGRDALNHVLAMGIAFRN